MSVSDKNPLEEVVNSFYKATKGVEFVCIATFYATAAIILILFLYLAIFPFLIAGWKYCLLTVLMCLGYVLYCIATWDGK